MTNYNLVISENAAATLAVLPDEPHELFTLACLYDLPRDPYGLGMVDERLGPVTTLTHALGGMGYIVYEVDEEASPKPLVTIVAIIAFV